ncbi:unnamed protein product [Ixodes hexagonus]
MQQECPTRGVLVLVAYTAVTALLLAGLAHGLTSVDPSVTHVHAGLRDKNDCPTACTCRHKEQGTVEAICSRRVLKTVPLDLTPRMILLDLSFNKIDSLDDSAWSGLCNESCSLKSLNLHQNQLLELGFHTFHSLQSLETLDLSDNRLNAINLNSLDSLEALVSLNLSGNRLERLKHEWFQDLTNLTVLDLSRNYIHELNNVVFWSLHKLVHLRVDRNRITSVGLLSLKGLDSLRTLNISHNQIATIPSGTLKPTLEILDISHNPIRNLRLVFKHAHRLRRLYASHLRALSHLARESFEGLDVLEELLMTNCWSLETIDPGTLEPLGSLRKLDIRFNNFTTLPAGLFHPLVRVERVQLHGNPWFCDCRLHWLLLWLDHVPAHLLSPSATLCAKPLNLSGHTVLDAVDKHMTCTNATVVRHTTQAHFRLGSSALLHCDVEGSPEPSITWITPHRLVFNWTREYGASVGNSSVDGPVGHDDTPKFVLLDNGKLFIREVQRGDSGYYRCKATNVLSHDTVAIHLTLDYDFLIRVKIVSILVGCATALAFVLATLIGILVSAILRRFGLTCPCDVGANSPRAKQLYRMLESLEHYRCQQLDRLRDNYAGQVQRIKDNCVQQMEKLRDSYSGQTERLRDFRDYGTAQIDRIRDNYYMQVQRVRDYGVSQIDRLRENYVFQRSRIRKFSTTHLYKLRENYKLQQQHLNKILENLNLESCRSVCARTDSIIFDPAELGLMPPPPPLDILPLPLFLDQLDTESQLSAYYTPDNLSEVSPDEIVLQPHFPFEDTCFNADLEARSRLHGSADDIPCTSADTLSTKVDTSTSVSDAPSTSGETSNHQTVPLEATVHHYEGKVEADAVKDVSHETAV